MVKHPAVMLAVVLLMGMGPIGLAQSTRHVSSFGSHTPPFTSWVDAATNIQAALDAADEGDTIRVADGVYREPEIVVRKPVALISVNGAHTTVVDAGLNHRCLQVLTNAVVDGFTLTGGWADLGGGAQLFAGAELRNCRVLNNVATRKGGGVHCFQGGKVYGCVIAGNSVSGNDGGGGVWLDYGGNVEFCTVAFNQAAQRGGGIYMDRGGGVIRNSIIEGNAARYGGGVMFFTAAGNGYAIGEMNNCLLRGNIAGYRGGGVYANLGGEFYNCTIVDNVASNRGGGVFWSIDDFGFGAGANSIVYYNQAPEGADYDNANGNGLMTKCCTLPNPGYGCITNAPLLVDRATGNLRLRPDSPCVDAGENMHVLETDLDLDSRQRVVNQIVDMGAYEWIPDPDLDSDGDGLSDWVETGTGVYQGPDDTGTSPYLADSDGDGMNDGDEVLAGFDPTDSESVFRISTGGSSGQMKKADYSPDPAGIRIHWPSVEGKTYRILRSVDLTAGFVCIGDLMTATPPENEYVDPFGSASACFYAVQLVTP